MKTSLKILLLLFFTVLNVACNHGQSSKTSEKSGEVTVISPEAFQEKSKDQTIVDVRTPAEYASGHIEGAVNIDFLSPDFLEEIDRLDKSETVFIYCRSGNRSSKASSKMRDAGFEQVIDLQGGIINWSKSNKELVK